MKPLSRICKAGRGGKPRARTDDNGIGFRQKLFQFRIVLVHKITYISKNTAPILSLCQNRLVCLCI